MKERPILFSAPMIKALLEGRKTQTRRIAFTGTEWSWVQRETRTVQVHPADHSVECYGSGGACIAIRRCPYGKPGDRLWVKETHASPGEDIVAYRATGECGAFMGDGGGGRIWLHHGYILEAPGYPFGLDTLRTFGLAKYGGRWRPSIHMPRWASRITLEITDVRVQRVEEISEADALAEGMRVRHEKNDLLEMDEYTASGIWHSTARAAFLELFYDINERAKRGTNPWVWALTFKVVKP